MATCSSADSVLNAAAQIKSNAVKLNDFVNGDENTTVQLGDGARTPSLKKLVHDVFDDVATDLEGEIGEALAGLNIKADKADNEQAHEGLGFANAKIATAVAELSARLTRMELAVNELLNRQETSAFGFLEDAAGIGRNAPHGLYYIENA